MLWDRCFDLAPEPSKQFVLALKTTSDSPRDAGFKLRTWAVAHARTKDEQFLKMIAASLDDLERSATRERRRVAFPRHRLRWRRAARAGAARVALRAIAAREDAAFCALPHALKTKGGFTVGDSVTPMWIAGCKRHDHGAGRDDVRLALRKHRRHSFA
jgi:hypothetical protein